MVKRGISFRRFILSDFGRVSGFVRGAVRRELAAFISRAARRGAGRGGAGALHRLRSAQGAARARRTELSDHRTRPARAAQRTLTSRRAGPWLSDDVASSASCLVVVIVHLDIESTRCRRTAVSILSLHFVASPGRCRRRRWCCCCWWWWCWRWQRSLNVTSADFAVVSELCVLELSRNVSAAGQIDHGGPLTTVSRFWRCNKRELRNF